MSITAIVRSPSLVEKVCQQLAQFVRENRTGDDGWLPTERELSAQLGVSRSVVREATKRLEMQGLLEIRQGIGIRAVDELHKPLNSALTWLVPDEEDRLLQLLEIRQVIEPLNARLAAKYAGKGQIDRLRAAHQRLIEAEEVESAVKADLDFHREIAEASGNQIAALLIVSLCDLFQTGLRRGYSRVSTDSAIREHALVLNAIARGDGPAASRAMTRHILTTHDELALPRRKNSRKKHPKPTLG